MPDLSAYIEFNVKFDIRNRSVPVMILTDVGTYPFGVAAGITGIFEITQPDDGVYTGDWLAPDIVYASGSLQPASISMRLATGNVLQPGTYRIKYTIDHASYSPTILTKTFTISYTSPTPSVVEYFDVFTPLLYVADETSYVAPGWTIATPTLAWTAVIGTVGTVTGSSTNLNLAYGGDYYDAAYDIDLVATFLATHNSYSYLTVWDKLTTDHDTDAWTPPTAAQLLGYLKTLKGILDGLVNTCQRYERAKADYEYSLILYTHIKYRVCSLDTVNLYTYIQELLDILHYHHALVITHTNAVIDPYNYDALCSTGLGSGVAAYYYKCLTDMDSVTIPFFIGKTVVQISLDGIIRPFTQGGSPPFIPPLVGDFYFENDNGKFWYTAGLFAGQYIWILYNA